MSGALDINYKEECINGNIYLMSPTASPKHGRVAMNLTFLIGPKLREAGCEIYSGNLDVYFNKENYVIPDLVVVCDLNKFTEKGYEGVPNLVVEIISPTSVKRDRIEKFELYEKYKVPEYIIVDYNNKSIEQYVLVEDKYTNKNVWTLLCDSDYERLTENQRQNYTTKFKINSIKDLEIDLKDIFSKL